MKTTGNTYIRLNYDLNIIYDKHKKYSKLVTNKKDELRSELDTFISTQIESVVYLKNVDFLKVEYEVQIKEDKIKIRLTDDIKNNLVLNNALKYIEDMKTTPIDTTKLIFEDRTTKTECEFGFDEID